MTPTRDDIAEMDRLSRILAGERIPPTAASATTSAGAPDPNAIILSTVPTTEDVSNMANIMKNFAGATGTKSFTALHDTAVEAVEVLVEDSQEAPLLREALITTQTDQGIKIGAWEITKHLRESVTAKDEYIYRVHNTNTGKKIKASFLIVESAMAMVKLLNDGADFSHPKVRQIAQFEVQYRESRKRALEEKVLWRRAKDKHSNFKMSLYEAKFDAAKTKALLIRERVINLYNQL